MIDIFGQQNCTNMKNTLKSLLFAVIGIMALNLNAQSAPTKTSTSSTTAKSATSTSSATTTKSATETSTTSKPTPLSDKEIDEKLSETKPKAKSK